MLSSVADVIKPNSLAVSISYFTLLLITPLKNAFYVSIEVLKKYCLAVSKFSLADLVGSLKLTKPLSVYIPVKNKKRAPLPSNVTVCSIPSLSL
nr:MAG TPA: hypothetical protein [Caudoviricetes sp.]